MEKQTITKENLKEIHDIACNEWKDTIKNYANREPFSNEITLTSVEINSMYAASDKKQLKVLKKFFVKEENIIDRVNSYEDACKVLNTTPVINIASFEKISLIIKALNEGWKPDFNNSNQNKYYNYFRFEGTVFSYFDASFNYGNMTVPSALYLKSYELAKHCKEIAFDAYRDLYCSL